VVAAQHDHRAGLVDLHAEQQQHHLDRKWPPVDLVAHEELVVGARLPAELDDLDKVVVLPVDVAHDDHGVLEAAHVGFLLENDGGLLDDVDCVLLGHLALVFEVFFQ